MRNTLIEIRNLSKKFGADFAVNDVSLDIYDQEFLVLLGPSGCGKTTLLRMLGGFENPTTGSIHMEGRDIVALPPNKRPLNMVFQSYAVFPHMNVRDNIAYGLRMDGVAKAEIVQRVDEALALVQLDALANRYAHQLSGGQRQRVALARALVKRPRVLLLDEPLSALDAKLREAMQQELVKLQHTVGITFVVVTHDQDEALSMAERVAVMDHGRIRQLDTPRVLYEAPRNRFVADFVGRMNILPAHPLPDSDGVGNRMVRVPGIGQIRVADVSEKSVQGESLLAQQYKSESGNTVDAEQSPICVAIRPEKLFLAADADEPAQAERGETHSVRARVKNIAYYGGETVLTVTTLTTGEQGEGENGSEGATLTIAIANSSRRATTPQVGEQVVVWWCCADMITLRE